MLSPVKDNCCRIGTVLNCRIFELSYSSDKFHLSWWNLSSIRSGRDQVRAGLNLECVDSRINSFLISVQGPYESLVCLEFNLSEINVPWMETLKSKLFLKWGVLELHLLWIESLLLLKGGWSKSLVRVYGKKTTPPNLCLGPLGSLIAIFDITHGNLVDVNYLNYKVAISSTSGQN